MFLLSAIIEIASCSFCAYKQPAITEPQIKILKFDLCAVPKDAIVRTLRGGDKFAKFGGGTKKLCDYFTDKKIPPVRPRKLKDFPLSANCRLYKVSICSEV